MSKVYAIYPINEELNFFRKSIRLLRNAFGDDFEDIRLSNNKLTHEICLYKIEKIKDDSNILFFGHGYSNSLLGCSYKKNQLGQHPKSYIHGALINRSNCHILNNKKLICCSCHSNDFATIAIEAGAKVVIGFNEINFDEKDLIENGTWNKYVVAQSKWKLRQAIFWTLIYSKKNSLNFGQFTSKLKLVLNKLSSELIIDNKGSSHIKYYTRAANCLDEIDSGIRVWGNSNLKIFN